MRAPLGSSSPLSIASLLGLSLFVLALTGCDCSGETRRPGEGSPCETSANCGTTLECVDRVCRTRTDGGTIDGATIVPCVASRTCGDVCCAEGEVCGGDSCCAPSTLCGGSCCGADERCDVDRCVLECGERALCGTGDAQLCCAAGELCYLDACVVPGDACTRSAECPEGEYCEATAMRCLPRAPGAACEYRPPVGPLELAVEWSWTGDAEVVPANDQVMMAPVVANLTDDDGDGDVDRDDIPDVVFHSFPGSDYWNQGVIRAVSGRDGSRLWPAADPGFRTSPGGEIAIAELDSGSLGPELAVCSSSNSSSRTPGHLMILSAAGTVLRRFDTAPNDVPCGFDAPAIGDMDGDGTPEIVVRYVIAHADGTVVRRLRDEAGSGGTYTTLANVDADPDLELVGSNAAYDYDGTALWDRTAGAPGRDSISGGPVAIADLDLDGDPELVIVTSGNHSIRAVDARTGDDHWGPFDINPMELMSQWSASPNGGGPPTIANFDEDPYPEIAFAGGYAYVIFGHDGMRQWWYETVDRSSRVTGSSIFDFEGDGIAEVLYNDERTFRVFRGTDGAVLYERCNTSGTLREYPIVVDVDADDQAEIILMANNYAFGCLDGSPGTNGILVLGHPRGEWVRTRRIWNQHTYHVTNVEEDGRIPAREVANWTVPALNNFRQNVQPDGLFDAPDLVLADLIATTRACPSAIQISARVVNRGAAGAPAGVPVTFYRVEGATRTAIGRTTTTRPLLPGESERVTLTPDFPVPAGMERVTFQFVAVLNDPSDMPLETLHECRDENNESAPAEATCPSLE
ncbi:MAG: hypothetical protein M3Y87_13365 [Myxococcota bacterium]|nr:hypothetical protein [Myxococcota bacterium]